MAYKTVVSVNEPVLDPEGKVLDTEGKVIEEGKKKGKVQVPAFKPVHYYLLHWGLTYTILTDRDSQGYPVHHPVSYTVGICEAIEGGAIMMFTPSDLTVVGKERV